VEKEIIWPFQSLMAAVLAVFAESAFAQSEADNANNCNSRLNLASRST
jgi:hypothetical protein